MKKFLIFGTTCLCAAIIGVGADAATKCVKLSPSTRCTSSAQTYLNRGEWMATCDGISVSGIAQCISNGSYKTGTVKTSVSTGDTASKNIYCVCKITSPVISRWVVPGNCGYMFCFTSLTADQCSEQCGYICASTIAGTNGEGVQTAFMSAIFSNFSD